MENNIKNELNRMFALIEYDYSKSKNFINEGDYTEKKEEKEEFPIKIARIGDNKIRIEDASGNTIDVDSKLKDEFIQKLTEFKLV